MPDWEIREHLNTCRELLEECSQCLYGLTVKGEDNRGLVVSSIYARSLELYSGFVTTLMDELTPPARVLARALMEALFTMRAVSQSDKVLRRYVGADEHWRRKMVGKAQRSKRKPLASLGDAKVADLLRSIEASIKQFRLKQPLKVEQMAIKAGLHDMYLLDYSILSNTVHTSVRDLADYLELDEHNEIQALRIGRFDKREAAGVIAVASLAMLKCNEVLGDVFDLDVSEIQSKYDDRFKSLLQLVEETAERQGV